MISNEMNARGKSVSIWMEKSLTNINNLCDNTYYVRKHE